MLTLEGMPDVKMNATGNGYRQSQPLTVPNVLRVLTHMDCVVRFNMMRAEPAYFIGGVAMPDEGVGVVLETLSDILVKLDINNLGRLGSILQTIAQGDPFHPMEDWVKGVPWDGVDHIAALMDTVKTPNALWPTYLENWLVQVMEGVCGWRGRQGKFSLPYVLVLVGGQGVGKSHWLATMGGGWMKGEAELHLSSPSGKDHQLEVLKWPMAELAELDGIFRKSDISHMKSFISREQDSIRAPYARRAIIRDRMTAFAGSVNDAEFLNDTTGSRRFWPVEVEAIVWDFEMDWQQLWAQAYAFWCESPAFALTAEEDAQRAGTAIESHTLISAEEEKIREYYNCHVGNPLYPDTAMNRTEILEMLYGKNRAFSSKQISGTGKILADIVGKHRTIGKKQRAWMFPYNEFAADTSTWPDNVTLRSV